MMQRDELLRNELLAEVESIAFGAELKHEPRAGLSARGTASLLTR